MGQVRRDRKVATTPRNPYERERLVKELELMGIYGLKTKNELWTTLTQITKHKGRARELLINTDDNKVLFHGRSLLNKLISIGLIAGVDFNNVEDIKRALREVLNLELSNYLERRLQTQVYKAGLSKNINEARIMIFKKQIVVKGRVINTPSFVIKAEEQGHIEVNPMTEIKRRRASKVDDNPKEEE